MFSFLAAATQQFHNINIIYKELGIIHNQSGNKKVVAVILGAVPLY